MKTIKLKRLEILNFKCHRSLTLEFEGRNAVIYGDNGSGKSSIYDALLWLLFGRDSRGQGEKNIEIKPLAASGEVLDHEALTEVCAIFTVNGSEVSLRRTLKEIWATKRGFPSPVFEGNTSEYYVDGVPVKKYAFSDKVEELVTEEEFKALTGVTYFANEISWQERRALLFRAAGTMDDRTVMAMKEDFAPLALGMGNLSLDDYKKKLTAEKKKYTGARSEIPARISECEKTVSDLSGIDFEGAKMEIDALSAKKESLAGELLSIERNTAAEAKELELKKARLELSELCAANDSYRRSQGSGKADPSAIKAQISAVERKLLLSRQKKKELLTEAGTLDSAIAKQRELWMAENAKEFSAIVCPTCKQPLPSGEIAKAKEAFEASKKAALTSIEDRASNLKAVKATNAEQSAVCDKETGELESEIESLKKELAAAESEVIEVHDMEGFDDTKESLSAWIATLERELSDLRADTSCAASEIRQKISAVNAQISDQMEIVGKEGALRYAKARIDTLQEDARKAAESLTEIERLLYLCDEFVRFKTSFIEDSVNSLFRIARFRLFREQANGGLEERCDVISDGVPYSSVNSGMRINLGIDIINTLSRVFGVTVPLFIDNAESVTEFERTDAQVIKLTVSKKDKELRIEYED